MAKRKNSVKDAAIVSDDEWRARDDMHTLARAEEIRNDPARFRKAVACGKKEIARMQKAVAKK